MSRKIMNEQIDEEEDSDLPTIDPNLNPTPVNKNVFAAPVKKEIKKEETQNIQIREQEINLSLLNTKINYLISLNENITLAIEAIIKHTGIKV